MERIFCLSSKANNNNGTDGRTRFARTPYFANENPTLRMGTSFAPSGHVVGFKQNAQQEKKMFDQ